jgi:predicted SnoaL-like aldol condensation-catalyzing enzyme
LTFDVKRNLKLNTSCSQSQETILIGGVAGGIVGQFPQVSVAIKRVIAEGDLVVTHGLINRAPEDRGMAAVDIFRLHDGKIVEHWGVQQPLPERAANDNTMV